MPGLSRRLLYRVTAPTLTVSLLVLVLDVWAGWYLHDMHTRATQLTMLDVSGMRAAEELEIRMREVRNTLNRYLRTQDPANLAEIEGAEPDADALIERARALARSPRELEQLDALQAGSRRFFAEFRRLGPHARDAETRAELGRLVDELMAEEIFRPARDYVEFHRDSVARESVESREAADRLSLGLLVLGIGGSLAGLLAGFVIARGLNRSMVQLSVPIRGAAGKLTEVVGPINVDTVGGFEGLEASLSRLAEQVGTVVARLQKSEREVLRGEQLAAVGQLAAGLAHELRNPLMPIRMLVQTAVDGHGLSHRDLAVLDEEITRLDRSIQTFLDFARPPRPDKRALDVCEIVRQTVELMSGRATRQGIEVCTRLPFESVVVVADAAQLRQVVLNLLLNALDGLPDGGRVTVTVRGGAVVSIEVADTGAGVPVELLDRIFEPFVSTKETGSGLGLSICRRIVETHGGRIVAENASGGGAVFRVTLPRAPRALASTVELEKERAHG